MNKMDGITKKEIQQVIEEVERGYYRDDYDWHGVDGATLDIDPENDKKRIIETEGNSVCVTWNGEGTFQEDGEKKEIEYIATLEIGKEKGWIVSENWELDIQKNNGGR